MKAVIDPLDPVEAGFFSERPSVELCDFSRLEVWRHVWINDSGKIRSCLLIQLQLFGVRMWGVLSEIARDHQKQSWKRQFIRASVALHGLV